MVLMRASMAGNVLSRYAHVACRNPRIAIGTVVCRLGVRVRRFFLRQPMVLFERHAGIGDIICTFPAMLELRKRHPNAWFIYKVRGSFKEIVKMGNVADQIAEADWSDRIPKISERDCDIYYNVHLEDERPRGRKHVHLVDDFARSLDVTLTSRQPRLYVPSPLSEIIAAKMLPLRRRYKYVLGIHTGPSWPVREWTVEGWKNLVAILRERLDCAIIQLGTDTNTAKGYVNVPRIEGTEDWVGKLSLDKTVAALKQLDLFIGIDSGLLHAAGAVGTRVVGLFGCIDPQLRLPPETPCTAVTADVACLGCHHRQPIPHWRDNCGNSIRCMSELSAESAFYACQGLLLDADLKFR